ncbi:sigma-54-dependent Fis family transcriptional regulator [Pseudalkalibacillus caeni]|uniref:AAA family ATPase n=1 Tax=Exobacillus caeni TaxID=2574798 RepID=A0A5R9FFT6_9BACL|nr:PrpR N-terminal domain-containing protein [Pseudalkalibacillus caeni]TLS38425.1 AAA family ATPase [Pseudalkalibacillus caeni]
MAKLLVIAPYQGLHDLFYQVNKELNKDMEIQVGNLYKGLEIAKANEHKGFDVIISRGATARIIGEEVSIPVVDLDISGYDILRSLTLLKGYSGKIGIMSYLNVVQGADSIGALLGIDLTSFLIHNEEEIESAIKKAKENDIEVMIGDVISTSVAQRYGMHGILITSGREAVIEAIERAEQIAYYCNKTKETSRLNELAIQHANHGIIVTDENGYCKNVNEKAAYFLQTDQSNLLNHRVSERVPFLNLKNVLQSRKSESFKEIDFGVQQFDISKVPLEENGKVVGAVAFLYSSKEDKPKSTGRPSVHFNQLVANSDGIKKTMESARNITNSNMPTIIYGESGTGKTSLAQAIHNESDRSPFPFVLLDINELSVDKVYTELFGHEGKGSLFERANGGTVCLKGIDFLPSYIAAKLLSILHSKKIETLNGEIHFDVRVISILEKQPEFRDKNRSSLYRFLSGFSIKLPPLRERKDDIEDLIRWFIASINANLGKQIVGVTPATLKHFMEYDWPGNIAELHTAVQEMCFLSGGPFIEEATALEVMANLKEQQAANSYSSFDLSKTLEEIEADIIHKIMEEENHNQTKVAARLGINRTTLWRKLKFSENV